MRSDCSRNIWLCFLCIRFVFSLNNLLKYSTNFIKIKASGCGLHVFFITFNLILCLIATIISLLPKVQEFNPTSGILQSSFVSLYVMYLTWSAMSNNSNRACNPSLLNIVTGKNYTIPTDGSKPDHVQVLDAASIVSLILWLCMVLYSTFSSASKGEKLINLNGNSESTAISDSDGKLCNKKF